MSLSKEQFDYVSQLTPLISVELLIKTHDSSVVLSWRDDEFYGPGWHVPGGIVRFKESLISRIRYVALNECGITEFTDCRLLKIYQLKNANRDIRGHFISFLFGVCTDQEPSILTTQPSHGSLRLFKSVPNNLISQHRRFIPEIVSYLESTDISMDITGNLLDESFTNV